MKDMWSDGLMANLLALVLAIWLDEYRIAAILSWTLIAFLILGLIGLALTIRQYRRRK